MRGAEGTDISVTMTNITHISPLAFAALVLMAAPALADPAEIVGVEMREAGGGWSFDVTVAHGDTGWDDYADGWRIETADGTVLGERPLAHPHVNEQPFTRSLSRVDIPDGVDAVMVRARTNVEGWDEATFGPYTLR